MSKPPRFSVVIPAVNGRGALERLLRCLAAQSFPRSEFECVIVEGGTPQESTPPEWAGGLALTTRWVSGAIKGARAQARDLGWRQAAGEIIVFLDDDLLPAPEWLESYDAAFERHLGEVISGGRYRIEANPESFGDGAGLGEPRHSAKLGLYPHPLFEKLEQQLPELCRLQPESLACAYSFSAANAAVSKRHLQRTSGFNHCLERFDDLELGIRLWELGARFGFANGADAYRLSPLGEMGRWLNVNELLALFCRHAYRLLFIMDFWAFYNSPGAPDPPWPIFQTLVATLAAAEQLTPEDLRHEFTRLHQRPLPADCTYNRERAVKFFCEFLGEERTRIETYVDSGSARGLFCERREAQLYFDINHTSNWIRENTLCRQNLLYRQGFGQGQGVRYTPFLTSQDRVDLLSLECRGAYELTIPAGALAGPWEAAAVSLPVPVEHACQTGVEITRCFPENLADYLDRSRTAIVGFPLDPTRGDEIRVSYEFRCRVQELPPATLKPSERGGAFTPKAGLPAGEPADLSLFLRPTIPSTHLPKAKAFLEQILPRSTPDPLEAARAISIWVHDTLLFLEPTFSIYPYHLVLDTGYGACVHLVRLFINLCRLAGIPAREQCGAYFLTSYVLGAPNRMETKLKGLSPFIHTWAEFYTPAHGWVPVEIYAHGARSWTALNVTDNRQRAELETHLRLFQGELLGYRDPFRIYADRRANKLPTYPVVKSKTGWTSLHQLAAQTSHRLTCHFVEIEQ
jgi:glycosyltransferase involved in cell wall biosynthesis